MAAHGGTIAEIRKVDGKATGQGLALQPPHHRDDREVTGPAAGSERLKTGADQTGSKVLGTSTTAPAA